MSSCSRGGGGHPARVAAMISQPFPALPAGCGAWLTIARASATTAPICAHRPGRMLRQTDHLGGRRIVRTKSCADITVISVERASWSRAQIALTTHARSACPGDLISANQLRGRRASDSRQCRHQHQWKVWQVVKLPDENCCCQPCYLWSSTPNWWPGDPL